MAERIVVAADLGASGGKMARGSFDGRTLKVGDFFDFPNQPVDLNRDLYWDLFGLYKSILSGLKRYGAETEVEAVSIDSWGATYGLLDNKGRLLEPVYHYRDLRTEYTMEKMYQVISKRKLFELTGCQPARSYTLPQLYSYVEHEEKILELADMLLFLPDLLAYFLTGEAAVERSIAGTSGLLLPDQSGWSMEVFGILGIPTGILRPLSEAGTERGVVRRSAADSLGIRQAKVIAAPSHDTASAIVGIPHFDTEQVYISIGTNINMGVEILKHDASEKAFLGGFKNAAVMEGRKILYRDFAACWLLNEFRRTCGEHGVFYSYQEMMELAEKSCPQGVFVDVEDDKLNNSGGDMKEKINAYLKSTGQRTLAEDGDFIRCILESIALKVKYCTEYLEKELNIPVRRVSAVNGGIRNHVLMQMFSDTLKRPVYCGLPYATLAGNVLTQLYALGELGAVEEIRDLSGRSFEMKEYLPKKEKAEYWDTALCKMREKGVCK